MSFDLCHIFGKDLNKRPQSKQCRLYSLALLTAKYRFNTVHYCGFNSYYMK